MSAFYLLRYTKFEEEKDYLESNDKRVISIKGFDPLWGRDPMLISLL